MARGEESGIVPPVAPDGSPKLWPILQHLPSTFVQSSGILVLMPTEKATAIVLRTVEFSETSLVVTLFTREFGKLGALAKGAIHIAFAVERLSLLAAIVLVDEPRWDGQERSTRYQNFLESGFSTPTLPATITLRSSTSAPSTRSSSLTSKPRSPSSICSAAASPALTA